MSAAYTELASCTVAGVPVRKLKSLKTGLIVCLAQVEGPLVNGFFCLATEAHDHDGLPHTLEHLIFLGSEDYPYKGVLDLLANRCLAQGTNAWTDVDHTCYTMTTGGSEGFLNLLPSYLDHILYPTLTDSGFVTEVHHVNGEGDDAGVVYCEMQARENTCEDRTHFAMIQHMYPGRCGYKSETGGRLKEIRTSCNNEKVRKYHHSYYRPDNLCLIVTGQMDPNELFETIAPFEQKILDKGSLPPMERPWQSEVPPMGGTATEETSFPTDDEADGMVRIAWRGPSALDRYGFIGITTLLEYLTDTSVAPLQRELVEVEKDPYCSEVGQTVLENRETCVGFTMSGVPTGRLGELPDKVLAILSGIAEGREAVDMKRMATVIKRKVLNIANNVEESPHYFFAFALIGDFLFGRNAKEFVEYVDQIPYYKRLLEEPDTFWKEMTKKYFINGHHVAILGSPSADLSAKMASEEKQRVELQRDKLGEEGLKEKTTRLEAAKAQNEIPAPDDVVSSLPVPGTDSIQFHPLVAMGNHQPEAKLAGFAEYAKMPAHKVPFFFQLNHMHSAFVELTVLLDTAVLPRELKLYLPLYVELLFESPVLRNGELVPYESVVKELAEDTVTVGAGLGMEGQRFSSGRYSQAVSIAIKFEAEKYARGVQWLHEVLYQIQFTAERLTVVANKMINDVARMKRKGSHVAKTLQRKMVYTEDSNHVLSSMVTQLRFLGSVASSLKKAETAEKVLADMMALREKLTSPDNLRVIMATDINTLPHPSPVEVWSEFLPSKCLKSPDQLPRILPVQEFLASVTGSGGGGRTLLAGVGGVESNFLLQSVPCVRSSDHPDLPPLMVFMEYLIALEGPMWRQIRGMGLAYSYYMYCSPESGLMYFRLFKSAQLMQAYQVARSIMDGFVTGKTPFERVQLEAAISGVIFEVIEREKTVKAAANQAVLCYLQDVDHQSYSKKLLSDLSHVTVEDLQRVGREYISKFLDPSAASTAVCCNPNKTDEIRTGLEKLGHSVETVEDLDSLSVF